MNVTQKRFLAFLIGCIGARTSIVYLVYKINKKYLPYLAYVGMSIALGFLYIFVNNLRKTGAEVFGNRIWWNILRPIHGFFYLWFACLAFNKDRNAYIPLLLDVSFGLLSFLFYHANAGSFNKL